MHALVTGAAGFIGSHLCEHLLDQGDTVLGVDCFTANYPRADKQENVRGLLRRDGFAFLEAEIAGTPPDLLLDGVDTVFHLAGQPGVRLSWGSDFGDYLQRNVWVTQQLLEACVERPLRKFVYASSSSIYGDAVEYPTKETDLPRPVSPYGVTKLAGEHLCELYRTTRGVPTASLRFFSVYGPRQRPDMAFRRIVRAAVLGGHFELYGDGEQSRDFTYVGDAVRAVRQAAVSEFTGVANIGGDARTTMLEVLETLTELVGPLDVVRTPPQLGDVRHTGADVSVARTAFGYDPVVAIGAGLAAMVAAERELVQDRTLALPEPPGVRAG